MKPSPGIRERLNKLAGVSHGQQTSINLRFKRMQKQIDVLIKRVKRLEGTDSPSNDSPSNDSP